MTTKSVTPKPHPEPIVEWFINNTMEQEAMLEALRALKAPLHPKVAAMLALRRSTVGELPFHEANAVAEKALQEASNVDLHLLFLAIWQISLSFFEPHSATVGGLVRQARALLSDTTPQEIRAWLIFGEAYQMLRQGYIIGAENLMLQALERLPPDSPHHSGIAIYRDFALLQRGMGADMMLVGELRRDHGSPSFRRRRAAFEFIDSVMRGDTESALGQAPVEEIPKESAGVETVDLVTAQHLLELLCEQRGLELSRFSPRSSQLPSWVAAARCLAQGRTGEALEWARKFVDEYQTAADRTIIGFDEYTLIRTELAGGNAEAARRLLLDRQEKGSVHYIDDLFWMRVELLGNNFGEAAQRYSAVIQAAERYRASGRIEYELSLACELSAARMFRVTQDSPRGGRPGRARRVALPNAAERERKGLDRLITSAESVEAVRRSIVHVSTSELPVLITGETGTGKELIASAIHEVGPRAKERFIAVNCGAISEQLIESELFGHKKGAFTGAAAAHRGLFHEAGRGTIFLDEIGEISPRLQIALLRVLETNAVRAVGTAEEEPIHCRILAATNADLDELTRRGQFRRDLLYRVQRLQITVPPLRERPEDVVVLANHFLNIDRPAGVRALMSTALQNVLSSYDWPGNVRELRNVIERMRLLNSDKLLYDVQDFRLPGTEASISLPARPAKELSRKPEIAAVDAHEFLSEGVSPLRRLEKLRALFRQHQVLKVLEIAELLDISRSTAIRYLKVLAEGLIAKVEPNASPRSHYYKVEAR